MAPFPLNYTKNLVITNPLRYDNPHDVGMRLKGTIIRYKNRPVYVSSVHETLEIDLEPLLPYPGNRFTVHSSDIDLDVSSVPLGWTNLNEHTLYLMRAAKNSQKQGVDPRSLTYFDARPNAYGGVSDRFRWETMDELCQIGKSMEGELPSFKECLIFARKGVAFHIHWALFDFTTARTQKFFTLYHKTTPVALVNPKNRTILFRKGRLTKTRRMELQEILREQGEVYVISEQK